MRDNELKRLQYISQTQAEVDIRTKTLIDELWSLRNQAEELRLEALRLVGQGHVDIEFDLDSAIPTIIRARRKRKK